MRITLIAFFLTTSAFACPQLAGTYECEFDEDTDGPSIITQETLDRVTTYNIDGIKMIADGKTRVDQDESDPGARINTQWKCNGTRSLDGLMKVYMENRLWITMKTKFKKTTAGYTMEAVASSGGHEERTSVVCRRPTLD